MGAGRLAPIPFHKERCSFQFCSLISLEDLAVHIICCGAGPLLSEGVVSGVLLLFFLQKGESATPTTLIENGTEVSAKGLNYLSNISSHYFSFIVHAFFNKLR